MIQTIRVFAKNAQDDTVGKNLLTDAQKILGQKKIENVRSVKIYRLEGFGEKDAETLTEKLFCEPINQIYLLNKSLSTRQTNAIEIAYKPGVMNPEVGSILKTIRDLHMSVTAVDTSTEYVFFGTLQDKELAALSTKLRLYNPLIEHVVLTTPQTLRAKQHAKKTTIIPLRSFTDDELLKLSKDTLFLNLEEMRIIQDYFQKLGRNPSDCELETIAQTWSEHCAHKTFKASLTIDGKKKEPLITRIKKEALKHDKHIISAFIDNAGVMDFYEGFALCAKAETHNSPSAIEPYGGAMTGSGGVFRDVVGTGKGAQAVVSTDIFCFAPPLMKSDKLPAGCLPPDYLLKRCVHAVRDYGNRVGIPTSNGSFHFHEDFRAKPTVLVGAYGILPKKYAQKGKPRKGDKIVVIGGRTGRDGIHGATFSSGAMTNKTISVNATAVQIGNAIEEKRVFDAILEARDHNLIRAITDCGAGGFSSAIGEMGEETGALISLEKAPLKYAGLAPWEIWIAESQERMVLAVTQKNLKKLFAICKKHNAEAVVLGTFTNTKRLVVKYKKKTICDLTMQFLHKGLPQRHMTARKPTQQKRLSQNGGRLQTPKNEREWKQLLNNILSHPNICSKEAIVRLYDHTVQGKSVVPPYSGERMDGPNDASVVRPLLEKPYGMIVAHGLNPILNMLDPYWGSVWAGAEAMANYVAVGGNYKQASLINNYVWPFPNEKNLWSLDRSVDAVVDLMKTLKIPVISGKDSLSSSYHGEKGEVIEIPPTLCISAFGKIPDVRKTATSDFKNINSLIYLVGKQDFTSLGGSVYYQLNDRTDGTVPKVDLQMLPKTLSAIFNGIQKNHLLSVHDVSEGGLITTIFEMCAGGDMGALLTLSELANKSKQSSLEMLLFNETAGCFIVEIENKQTAKKVLQAIPHVLLGTTQREKNITVMHAKKKIFSEEISLLKHAWQKPMQQYFSSL